MQQVSAPKPRRLTATEREHIANAAEHALNAGWDELRVYVHEGRVWTTPVRIGRREAADLRAA